MLPPFRKTSRYPPRLFALRLGTHTHREKRSVVPLQRCVWLARSDFASPLSAFSFSRSPKCAHYVLGFDSRCAIILARTVFEVFDWLAVHQTNLTDVLPFCNYRGRPRWRCLHLSLPHQEFGPPDRPTGPSTRNSVTALPSVLSTRTHADNGNASFKSSSSRQRLQSPRSIKCGQRWISQLQIEFGGDFAWNS